MPPKYQPMPLTRFEREVMNGLPNERKRLDGADENQAFYDHDAERYLAHREAESEFDFQGRSKRESGLLRQCVEILCDHLYNPGPTRHVKDDDAAGAFLELVYEQNLFNTLVQQADILSTLNDVCALQFDAGDGDFEGRPLDIILWGGNEFHCWTHADNPRRPVAVCTLDRYDMQERRRLWNEVEVRTYLTEQVRDGQTAGGRVAKLMAVEPHDYGCIPFAFVHYELPTRYFYPPGIGTFLRKVQERVDDRLSRLDESIHKHMNPIAVAEGVGPDWNPVIEPGRFLRVVPPAFSQITGDYSQASPTPRLSFLQGTIDVAGAWDDLLRFINQAMDAARVPLSYARMEQSGVASGISLIVEQAPLLNRAKRRRLPFAHYETEIARKVLACAGNHYGKPELARAADTLSLMLNWPEPTITVPGPERNDDDTWMLSNGLVSHTGILMERFGFSREQALERLKQIIEDRADEAEILGETEAIPRPVRKGEMTLEDHEASMGPPDPEASPGDGPGTGETTTGPDMKPAHT